jgi:hypothetical protein
MEYKKIHMCPNNCMSYYKGEDLLKDKCDICKESRYKNPVNKNGKPVARKVLRYLPITPKLQRLYMVADSVEHMRWHKEGIDLAWKHFDNK